MGNYVSKVYSIDGEPALNVKAFLEKDRCELPREIHLILDDSIPGLINDKNRKKGSYFVENAGAFGLTFFEDKINPYSLGAIVTTFADDESRGDTLKSMLLNLLKTNLK